MDDIVNNILEKTSKQDSEKYKAITVEKHLELNLDVGALVATDINDLNINKLKKSPEKYLLNLTRDNTQLLLNAVWELPTERVEEAIVAKLPNPKIILPRSKQIPKPRAPTRWEKFAKEKGIQKKNKASLSWDDQLQKWIPMYGYRRAVSEKEKDWVIEVPQNANDKQDMFATKSAAKSERVAKNDVQRMKNLAKQKGVKLPRMGFVSSDKLNSNQLLAATTVAKASTASLGKFQQRLPKEKDARSKGIAEITPGVGRKRKAQHLDLSSEKKKNLSTINALLSKKPTINIEMAVNKQIHQEQTGQAENKASQKRKSSKKKLGGKRKNSAKPAAGKGKRNPNKRTLGRKRR